MAFFKKKKLSDGKWHPIAVSLQSPATIDDVADELAARSTVSRADTYAVLVELGDVLGRLMASGRTVKLQGVGTFYLTCQTRGKGTDTPEELTPDMIAAKVRFIPEYSRAQNSRVKKRTIVPSRVEWTELEGMVKK